ncbi:MAG: outer membrane beta-barrel protein [Hyphomonadaceae bacterium]|nr:outer membrane beta-barrel protein [Hyphomonadaceae bacterium]MCA8886982.1 outer membrane beta-barrel protein [Hyphomonadaceae bacterium]
MARPGKFGRLAQALLIAASVVAVSAGTAHAQHADELESLNQQILDNPQDVDLNLRYARAAEDAGKLRLALVAYERILINDPSNETARRGYERIRREIEPEYTVTRVEVGARWDSNTLNAPDDPFLLSTDDREATTYYGRLLVANEHEFFGRRWRSTLNVDLEDNADIDELDYAYVGLQTGPILYAGPHLAAIPSVGVAMSWLDGDEYYQEVNASLTVEGRLNGASYWWRARAGYRDYEPDTNFFFSTVTENGPYVEIQGGVTKPHVLLERDSVQVAPFVRWSDVDGTAFSFSLFDDVSPGKFLEYGADVNYNYQLTDHIQGSVGALLRERDFRNSSREDTYFSPQASVTFQDILPCDCDVRLQYRYRQNDSNDYIADYDADQVSLALLARF